MDINEADIAKVGIGSPVVVALDAYPDKQFDATVVKVYPAADRQKGTVKIEVKIARAGFADHQAGNERQGELPGKAASGDAATAYHRSQRCRQN